MREIRPIDPRLDVRLDVRFSFSGAEARIVQLCECGPAQVTPATKTDRSAPRSKSCFLGTPVAGGPGKPCPGNKTRGGSFSATSKLARWCGRRPEDFL